MGEEAADRLRHEHVWFTTQPIEEPRDPRNLERITNMVGARNPCFSTDFPHWDDGVSMHLVFQ